MRTGAEAGIKHGKWSVIMDWFYFALFRMRRPLVRFAVSSLRRRDTLGKGLTDNMCPVDRVAWLGA